MNVEAAGDAAVAALIRAHGCPPGCHHCAAAAAQKGVPALLEDWRPYAGGRDTLRLWRLYQATGRPFPTVTNDDVVQFCIEEALHERSLMHELEAAAIGEEPANPALEQALELAREFARTGVRR